MTCAQNCFQKSLHPNIEASTIIEMPPIRNFASDFSFFFQFFSWLFGYTRYTLYTVLFEVIPDCVMSFFKLFPDNRLFQMMIPECVLFKVIFLTLFMVWLLKCYFLSNRFSSFCVLYKVILPACKLFIDFFIPLLHILKGFFLIEFSLWFPDCLLFRL